MAPSFRLFSSKPATANDTALDVSDPDAPRFSTDSKRSQVVVGRRSTREDSPPEYKLSVVNDNGVYLPPSPTEENSLWSTAQTRGHNNSRSLVDECEPFSISRESFDSYRRSFDISARSPVATEPRATRSSLDSRLPGLQRFQPLTNRFESTEEEAFEDVRLNEETTPGTAVSKQMAGLKKKFMSRFTSSQTNESEPSTLPTPPSTDNKPASSHFPFSFGRRRVPESNQTAEAELSPLSRPSSSNSASDPTRKEQQ